MHNAIIFKKRIPEPKAMEAIEMAVFDALSKENYRRWMLPLVDDFLFRTRISEGTIVDIACGPGLLSKALAERSKKFTVVGIDISVHALGLARKNCAKLKNTRFIKGSVYALPFKTESADAVICKDSFHHFDRPASALKEMLRVLKPNGYVYIQDMRRDVPQYSSALKTFAHEATIPWHSPSL
jgi:ubiquinone/menaquinone biosynthesis C-methylase UbiE